MMGSELEDKIKELREQLAAMVVAKQGNFADPDVMKLSMKIDELVVQWQKEKTPSPLARSAIEFVKKKPEKNKQE